MAIKKTRSVPKDAKKMGAPASARQKAGKMKSTGSAKPTTVSRGSKTAKQMGDMNAMENVRVNKYYKNIVSNAEVKGMKSEGKSQSKTFTNARGEKFGANGSEVARARKQQRAGGSKNLGPMEKKPMSKAAKVKAMPKKPAGVAKKTARQVLTQNQMKGASRRAAGYKGPRGR